MDKDKAVDKANAKNEKEEYKKNDVSVCMCSRIVGCKGEDMDYLWARTKTR